MVLAPLIALLALVALEIYVIVVVAHAIGAAWTIAALLASTVGGLWLVRAQRRRAWSTLREAVASGAIPGRNLGDAVLIFVGGVLIAIPGFVTDALGLLAVAPITRPAMRRLLGFFLLPRAARRGLRFTTGAGEQSNRTAEESSAAAPDRPAKVIRGQVIDRDSGTAS